MVWFISYESPSYHHNFSQNKCWSRKKIQFLYKVGKCQNLLEKKKTFLRYEFPPPKKNEKIFSTFLFYFICTKVPPPIMLGLLKTKLPSAPFISTKAFLQKFQRNFLDHYSSTDLSFFQWKSFSSQKAIGLLKKTKLIPGPFVAKGI